MTDLNSGGESRRRGATVAQLKHDIDSGRTGDKVGGFDPAASPLGTDDEAAGAPPSPEVVAQARAQETAGRPDSRTANAATPELQPDARGGRTAGVPFALLAGVILALALAALLLAVL